MTWHGRPWHSMARASEVREQGAAIKGLKRGIESYLAQTVKIATDRGVKGPRGPPFDVAKERKVVFSEGGL